RPAFTSLTSVRVRVPAELDEPRLVLVQLQLELPQSPAEVLEEPPSILLVFEAHHEVVGEPHDDEIATRMPPPPLVRPEVEDIVQVEVRQERRLRRALRGSHLARRPPTAIHDPGAQPLLDEANHAPVSDPVL